ncbi:MAG TPA: type II toxin-antitoxin system VapC family toxin [Candidatus Dormibacteraeota bacterium]|nr:type II toxin-antitoxin system VapC family toxin [Candidatus Dormibacteraeota bacterium]
MTWPSRGILDTSVFIANESGRALEAEHLPDESAISVVTLAELQVGVLAALDTDTRAARLATVALAMDMEVLPVEERVALAWAHLRVRLADAGRRVNVNDLWIAATAVAQELPVVTQDTDFDALEDMLGLSIVRV